MYNYNHEYNVIYNYIYVYYVYMCRLCVRVSFGQKLTATMISARWDESAGARHAKWQATWTNQTVSRF